MKQPRFSVKWNNGYWKLFDNERYEDVALYLLESQVVIACAKMNHA